MPAAEPIRSNADLKRLANYFLVRKRFRDYCLLVLGVCSALRISDLLSLRWEDVWDENRDRAKKHVYIVEQKTGKSKTFALNPKAEEALRTWRLHMKSEGGYSGVYIFEGRQRTGKPITRKCAWEVIKKAARDLGIDGVISPHSLRKTFGYHGWADNNVNPAILMDIYNHSSFEVTRRYLGIQQDDLDNTYLSMDLF